MKEEERDQDLHQKLKENKENIIKEDHHQMTETSIIKNKVKNIEEIVPTQVHNHIIIENNINIVNTIRDLDLHLNIEITTIKEMTTATEDKIGVIIETNKGKNMEIKEIHHNNTSMQMLIIKNGNMINIKADKIHQNHDFMCLIIN